MSGVQGHLLVVDDDERLRKLLQKFLSEHGYAVNGAADAASARQLLEWLTPDMMIVDVMMPGETGLEFVASLRHESRVPVLMLSALGDVDDRIRGLELGADDYLPKPFEPKELLLRVRRIIERGAAPADDALSFGPYRYEPQLRRLTRAGEGVHLTTAEAALMASLAAMPGKPVARAQLAAQLGLDAQSGERGVDVHVTRLRRKIEEDPRHPAYLVTVRGEGYALMASGGGI